MYVLNDWDNEKLITIRQFLDLFYTYSTIFIALHISKWKMLVQNVINCIIFICNCEMDTYLFEINI